MRRLLGGLGAIILAAAVIPPPATAQIAISDDDITITGSNVLTTEHATPLYARATGENNPANRLVKLGDTVLVNNYSRGLTLSIFDANGHVSSTNYDTFISPPDSDSLAGVLAVLGNGQIGLLTSADAFEQSITEGLRAEARRLGLVGLATRPSSNDQATWRHPYVAIFYGSPATTPNRQAVEIMQTNAVDAPYAILATWLIDDGFVGQALEARPDPPCFDFEHRFVNCGNGTVTDTVTGLIYLEKAHCFGTQDWVTANQSAAGLADGACDLTDGSRPGDWRLQTKEEWEGILDSSCTEDPQIRIVGNQSPTPGCYTDALDPDSSWASGVKTLIYWSSTTRANSENASGSILSQGVMAAVTKTSGRQVWPVRSGQ